MTKSLTTLTTTARGLPASLGVPPEIIEYVEEGRNPDIYTREFVELAQSRNQLLKGKADAFAAFRDALAREIQGAIPELSDDVSRLVQKVPKEDDQKATG